MSIEFMSLLLTAFVLGLGSSTHCLGMCGGIVCALGLQQHVRPIQALMLYNVGRTLAYATLALVAGTALQQLTVEYPSLIPWMRTAAAILLLSLALHTLQWWRGILVLEKAGQWLWLPIQRIGKHLLSPRIPLQAFFVGFMWGWLPCALVYSTLVWAITQTTGWHAALLMLAFGAGTAPALFVSGLSAEKLSIALRSTKGRMAMALLLFACAIWTLFSAWAHVTHSHHAVSHSDQHTKHPHHHQH